MARCSKLTSASDECRSLLQALHTWPPRCSRGGCGTQRVEVLHHLVDYSRQRRGEGRLRETSLHELDGSAESKMLTWLQAATYLHAGSLASQRAASA